MALQNDDGRRLDAKACCCFYKILLSAPAHSLAPLNTANYNRAAPPCFYYRAATALRTTWHFCTICGDEDCE